MPARTVDLETQARVLKGEDFKSPDDGMALGAILKPLLAGVLGFALCARAFAPGAFQRYVSTLSPGPRVAVSSWRRNLLYSCGVRH